MIFNRTDLTYQPPGPTPGTYEYVKALCAETSYVRLSDTVGDYFLLQNQYEEFTTGSARNTTEPILVLSGWYTTSYDYPRRTYDICISKQSTLTTTKPELYDKENDPALLGTKSVSGTTLYVFCCGYAAMWAYAEVRYSEQGGTEVGFGELRTDATNRCEGFIYTDTLALSGEKATELQSILEQYASAS